MLNFELKDAFLPFNSKFKIKHSTFLWPGGLDLGGILP